MFEAKKVVALEITRQEIFIGACRLFFLRIFVELSSSYVHNLRSILFVCCLIMLGKRRIRFHVAAIINAFDVLLEASSTSWTISSGDCFSAISRCGQSVLQYSTIFLAFKAWIIPLDNYSAAIDSASYNMIAP